MAGQYEDAFSPQRLQNWGVPRPPRKRPSLRRGSTSIIADDRGHLLPTVPRSQVSPWGTFVGTWEMPSRIPPARLNLTARSAAAATRLLDWIQRPSALSRACNGLRTEITGQLQEKPLERPTAPEPPQMSSQASSKDSSSFQIPTQAHPIPREGLTPISEEGEGADKS